MDEFGMISTYIWDGRRTVAEQRLSAPLAPAQVPTSTPIHPQPLPGADRAVRPGCKVLVGVDKTGIAPPYISVLDYEHLAGQPPDTV